jgi:hypothetical protein
MEFGSMSENLFQLYTQQFTALLQMRLQQTVSKLRGLVMEGQHVGKAASPVNYMGPISAKPAAGVFAPLNRSDATFSRRWVFPQNYEIQQLIDQFTKLETIVDPTSEYARNAAAAVARQWDDILIAAALGTSQTGTDTGGLVAETFAQAATNAGLGTNGNLITVNFGASSTSVGATVEKLIEARRILRHLHVDLEAESCCWVAASQQEADMLKLTQIVSSEFNGGRPVLEEGRVVRFMGTDIRYSERLSTSTDNSTTARNTLFFPKSGMYLGIWQDMTNDVDIRKDLSSLPYQLYTKFMAGATRLEPGRMLQINCLDTQGSDIEGGVTGI